MTSHPVFNRPTAATKLGVSLATLNRWERTGEIAFPQLRAANGRPVYSAVDILRIQAWMAARDVLLFWSKVDCSGDCWSWLGTLDDNGYGIHTQSRPVRQRWLAHRYSWNTTRGGIPDEICVLHHCDNRRCVNPHHLFLGTRVDNNLDRDAKGRQRGRYTRNPRPTGMEATP